MSPVSIPLGFHHNGGGCPAGASNKTIHRTNEQCGIREVWAHNLESEFRTICQVGICNDRYEYVYQISPTYPENSQHRKFGGIALIRNEIVGYLSIIYGYNIAGGSNL